MGRGDVESGFYRGAAVYRSAPGTSYMLLYTGLGMMSVGNGFFKPNRSSMVGQLYPSRDKRLDAAYTIFYMGINVGGMLGPFVCGLVGNTKNPDDFKYAFPDQMKGNIYLSFSRSSENDYMMQVRDDGIGIPKHITIETASSLGLQLVDMLSKQIGGTIEVTSGKGTTFSIRFKAF